MLVKAAFCKACEPRKILATGTHIQSVSHLLRAGEGEPQDAAGFAIDGAGQRIKHGEADIEIIDVPDTGKDIEAVDRTFIDGWPDVTYSP